MQDESQAAGDKPRDARKWAMLCHLSALIGVLGNGVGFVLGPLVVWLLKKEDHPFIDQQGKEALNFQITMFIVLFICAILSLVVIGIFFLLIVGLLMCILPIVGAIKANDGVDYRYPIAIRFIK
jgi:uncharacterized Tic20 family protein